MEKYIPRKRNRSSWGLGILNRRAAGKVHLSNDLGEDRCATPDVGGEPSRQRYPEVKVQEEVCPAS